MLHLVTIHVDFVAILGALGHFLHAMSGVSSSGG